jgi:5-carboxymethyl-2-hydroxymuconate isomerase
VPDILAALAAKLSEFETINSADVKAYHTMHSNWAMGENAPEGFAHCQVSLLSGRTPELLKAIGEGMYSRLKELFAGSMEREEAALTLEVRQMTRETYFKGG